MNTGFAGATGRELTPELLNLTEVQALTRLSRTTIYDKMKVNKFPSGFKVSEARRVWRRAEILAYIDTKEAAANAA